VTPRPQIIPGKDTLPIIREAGWASVPVWTGAGNLAPTGIFFTSNRKVHYNWVLHMCLFAHVRLSPHWPFITLFTGDRCSLESLWSAQISAICRLKTHPVHTPFSLPLVDFGCVDIKRIKKYFSSCFTRPVAWCAFHRSSRRKSLFSCADWVRLSLILNHTICARIHNTAL
jgi:hypothetical protein